MDHTLVIPTFNRPYLLGKLLDHLRRSNVSSEVIIVDSSAAEALATNAKIIADADIKCRHYSFAPDTRPQRKFAEGLALVQTPYVSFCADDDVVFLGALTECLSILRQQADVIGCDGVYLGFEPSNVPISITAEYDGPSCDCDEPILRIAKRLDRYEATTYSVYRTEIAQRVFDAAADFGSALFWELFTTIAPLGLGKFIRLRSVYAARRAGAPTIDMHWHPMLWLKEDQDGFMSAAHEYLTRLADFLCEQGVDDLDWKKLAWLHVPYVRKECPDFALTGLADVRLSRPPVTPAPARRSLPGRIRDKLLSRSSQRSKTIGLFEVFPGVSDEALSPAIADLASYCARQH
jgi:glycosyltransferase domain-containing protein